MILCYIFDSTELLNKINQLLSLKLNFTIWNNFIMLLSRIYSVPVSDEIIIGFFLLHHPI